MVLALPSGLPGAITEGDLLGSLPPEPIPGWGFHVDRMEVLGPGEAEGLDIARRVYSVRFFHDYEGEGVFAEVVASAAITRSELAFIQERADKGKVVLTVSRSPASRQESPQRGDAPEADPLEKVLDALEFRIVDGLPRTPPAAHVEVTADGQDGADTQPIYDVHLGMILVSDIEKSSVQVDDTFEDCTAMAALAVILQRCYDGRRKFLVSPPDADRKRDQVSCREGNAREWAEALQAAYGIYSLGLRMFFDLDRCYVLSKDPSKSAYAKGEPRKVTLLVEDKLDAGPDSAPGAVLTKDKQWIVRVSGSDVRTSESGAGGRALLGREALLRGADPEAGAPQVTKADLEEGSASDASAGDFADGMADRGKRTRSAYLRYGGNQAAASELAEEARSFRAFLVASLTGADVFDVFKPNREHLVTFTEPNRQARFGGEYRLSSLEWTIAGAQGGRPDPSGQMTCAAVATLRLWKRNAG